MTNPNMLLLMTGASSHQLNIFVNGFAQTRHGFSDSYLSLGLDFGTFLFFLDPSRAVFAQM